MQFDPDIFGAVMDRKSPQPKFERIVDATRQAVRAGRLGVGQALPSINAMSSRYGMARETVRKSYEKLRQMGLVTSRRGRGYSIASQRANCQMNVFVLFDAMASAYKETLFEALRKRLGSQAKLDCYSHHFQSRLFVDLLREARGKYQYYVVIPMRSAEAIRALAEMDQERLLILDLGVNFPGANCAQVIQDHDHQLTEALEAGLDRIRKYRKFTLVFPSSDRHHPATIKSAFVRFCRRHRLRHSVSSMASTESVEKGSAYLIIEDKDLVALVKGATAKKLTLGRDVGIISYNETPLKEIVAGGVTVVSVDFHELGLRAAETILGLNRQSVCLPTRFIARATL